MDFKKLAVFLFSFLFLMFAANATQEQIRVDIQEYVDQNVIFNPLYGGSGLWFDLNENQSSYNLTGYIIVTNNNPNGKTISDIYVSLSNTQNMTLPVNYTGRDGTFVSNVPSSGNLILHIPELQAGENSTWQYSVNTTSIRPPLNLTSTYSDTKVLAGDNFTITDTVENVFDNFGFQSDTCIYGINLTQVTVPVDFAGVPQDYTYVPSTTAGTDAGNVTYSADNQTQYWDLIGGNCLYKTNTTDINYVIQTPYNIPKTTDYTATNTTLIYSLNNSVSHLKVIDITAISEGDLSFEKQIVSPSHPTLYGSNVTWNVTGYFNTATNISYNLSALTLWVSQRNVNGSYTDPNTIDNDTISNATLLYSLTPNILVNSSNPFSSSTWSFNYSDVPSPIVWMDVNFTIENDGTQLVNRSISQNGNDIYVKEIYLILGYWLEIDKNITSLGNDQYAVDIDVHNKGNQVTPADSIVTIYDFVPSNYNVTSPMVYSTSTWYSTASASNNVSGGFNGTLFQWGLTPSNVLNTSFAAGPGYNANTTWSVNFNVTGTGDYELLDVFVTGLDPQQVDGAGAAQAGIITEVLQRLKSSEGLFAGIASVLLLFGLLL